MLTFLGEIVTSSSVLDHLVLYPGATTAHIYCACAPFPEGFSAPRSVVPYFNRPLLSHVHGRFASMDVSGLLEIHTCQEC